jgi:hypothetical protein
MVMVLVPDVLLFLLELEQVVSFKALVEILETVVLALLLEAFVNLHSFSLDNSTK